MIDAFDIRLAPLTTELRDYARRQTGCKALIAAHYGIGGLCPVTILAELGDARRFDNSRDAVRYGGLDIAFSCRHLVDGLERTSGRNAYPSGIHPIDHHVADPEPTRIADQSKAGRPRAQHPPIERANAPPPPPPPPPRQHRRRDPFDSRA